MKKYKKSNARVRIIGGQWRGRKLVIAKVPGLRPTGDRIRETLFNWLLREVPGSRCLDLFAGSGALGLEALSRGADKVIMLEKSAVAAGQLHEHCRSLQAREAEVVKADCLHWLQTNRLQKRSVTIVFIDPPFAEALWNETIDRLVASRLLAEEASVYIEAPRRQLLTIPEDWTLHRAKEAGDVHCYLYRLPAKAATN